MFCDELKIRIFAGNGGNGCMSFRREKFVPKGGPDGGDGGRGGDIIVKVNNNLNTLNHLAQTKVYKAQSGEGGKGKNMHGKDAEDLILEVPVGTVIYNTDKSEVLADLSQLADVITIADGGKGGLGNFHFRTSTHQAPRFAETGEPGEKKEIILELKMVADVGLIGLPSVGKSTLISVISNARPKIAAYHFTTLSPNLGVVNMSKFGGSPTDTFVVADIPGLIEGASEGKGLGIQFLKHITRTKLLVHIIDPLPENTDKSYKIINNELKKFSKELAAREQIIVINKIDAIDEETLSKRLKELKKIVKTKKIFTISAVTHEGLQPLLFEISKKLIELKKKERMESPARKMKELPVLRPHLEKVKFTITKIEKTADYRNFYIEGRRTDQIIQMTNITNQEGLERIYYHLEKSGIKKAIEKAGAKIGDFVIIKEKSIPYRP
ncbi:MAG: GTPase ObgE [Candidatus Gracilibacteria bacterium]|jgi:GTP-binding protein